LVTTKSSLFALNKLRPNVANVRAHSKSQITQIADSIRQFGFASPIVADENGNILAGHGRWHAAKQLGLSLVPVVVLSGLSEAERRAYVLADNKLTDGAFKH
jgi:ParB-like chromosome segregation protein Spo0J